MRFPKTTFIPIFGEEAKEEACCGLFRGVCDPSWEDETPSKTILWMGEDKIPSDLLPSYFEHETLGDIYSERSL